MKESLIPGIRGEKRVRVEPLHVIDFMGPDIPQVLASPWMLMFMEHAARESVLPHLDPGEDTVGVGFEFEHLAATPLGATVIARAELIGVEGRKLRFRIEAEDGHETIGRGTHVRAVIDMARFAKRLKSK